MLNALQYLAQVFIHRIASNKLSIVVNVGNYREKRHEILERLAKRTAEKAKRTGRPVFWNQCRLLKENKSITRLVKMSKSKPILKGMNLIGI